VHHIKSQALNQSVLALSSLAINLVPLYGMLVSQWARTTTLALYFCEGVTLLVLTYLRLRFFLPAREEKPGSKPRVRREVIQGYLAFVGMGMFVIGVFLSVILFMLLKTTIPFSYLGPALLVIVVFQLIAFLSDFLLVRPASFDQGDLWIHQSMQRFAVLYFAIFIGLALGVFNADWVFYPFVALKILVDVGSPLEQIVKSKRAKAPVV
jgi:hypothetical protein